MTPKRTLICVTGPTASGKTALAIDIAKHYHTEILSADSRQFYREISIGTAKPTSEELQAVPHHFINNKSITETYSAGDFALDALTTLNQLFLSHAVVVMAGGSGLYVDAVCKGMDPLPTVSMELRNQVINLYQEQGLAYLQQEVSRLDPDYALFADLQNPQRMMRALEVMLASGKPFSSFRQGQTNTRDFDIVTIGLSWDRQALYQRIDQRVLDMITQGLEEEARNHHQYRETYAMKTVGYKEFFEYFDGMHSLDTTIKLIQQHTRNFAKRQITWFKRNENTFWVHPSDKNAIFEYLNDKVKA